MAGESVAEQVIVRFIADNAAYLKGIQECQSATNKFISTLAGQTDKVQAIIGNIAPALDKMAASFNSAQAVMASHAKTVDQVQLSEAKLALQNARNVESTNKLSLAQLRHSDVLQKYTAEVQKAMAMESQAIASVISAENAKSMQETKWTAMFLISENEKQAALARTAVIQNLMNAQGTTNAEKMRLAELLYAEETEKTARTRINAEAKVNAAKKQAEEVTRRSSELEQSNASRMFQHYTNLGAQLGFIVRQYLGLFAVVSMIRNIVETGMGFNKFVEESTTAFTVMMNSATGAKNLMQDMYDFAVKSPLTFRETAEASKQLMAYGFQASELVDTMELLGTVGKAVGSSMQDMAYVYGTLRSQGRAYSRDLMQFGMRGIPIYEELAKVMGVSSTKIQKLAADGRIGFAEVEKAFINMTSSGGRFDGMLEKWMGTLEGKMSMLNDIMQKFGGELLGRVFDNVKRVVDELILMVSSPAFAQFVQSMAQNLGLLVEALIGVAQFLIAWRIPLQIILSIMLTYKIAVPIFNLLKNSVGVLAATFAAASQAALLAGTSMTVATFSAATLATSLKALFVSIASNPLLLALTAIVALVPVIIKGFDEANRKKMELIKTDRAVAQGTVVKEAEKTFKYSGVSIEDVLQGKATAKMQDVGMQTTAVYMSFVQSVAKKYDLEADAVLTMLEDSKTFSAKLTGTLRKAQEYMDMYAARTKAEGVKVPNASPTDLMNIFTEYAGLDAAAFSTALYKEAQYRNASGIMVPYQYISGYDVMGKDAARLYIDSFEKKMVSDKKLATAIGQKWTDDSNRQALEKEMDKEIGLYNEMLDKDISPRDTGAYDVLVDRLKAIVTELARIDKEKQALADLTKAIEKYQDAMLKLQDQITTNSLLGFNPSELQKLTAEYKTTIDAIEKDMGKALFGAPLTKEQIDAYKKLLEQIYNFNIAKINDTVKRENLAALKTYELEYAKLVLSQDEYAIEENKLALFDLELNAKLAQIQVAIDLNNEQSAGAQQQYNWAVKTGDLERKNLQDQIALTKAKQFLEGSGNEAYWSKLTLKAATALGMSGYASGTQGAKKGVALVGEKGPELVYMRGGETVIPNYALKHIQGYEDGTVGASALSNSDIINFLKNASTENDVAALLGRLNTYDIAGHLGTKLAMFTKPVQWGIGLLSTVGNWSKGALLGAVKALQKPQGLLDSIFGSTFVSAQTQPLNNVISSPIYAKFAKQYKDKAPMFARMEASVPGTLEALLTARSKLGVAGLALDAYVTNPASYVGQVLEKYAQIGGYVSGTQGAKKGVALVGEKGPELVYMQGGETVVPNHVLKNMRGYGEGAAWEPSAQASFNAGLPSNGSTQSYGESALLKYSDVLTGAIQEYTQQLQTQVSVQTQTSASLQSFGAGVAAADAQLGTFADVAKYAMKGTEVGRFAAATASKAEGGGGVSTLQGLLASIGPSVNSFAGLIAAVDNVNKLMNPMSTMLQGVMSVVGPALNGALKPLVDILTQTGQIMGSLLLPAIRLIGVVFNWLHDSVFVPVGNGIIDLINGLFKIINLLPFMNLAYIDHLQTVKQVTENAKTLATGQSSLTDTIAYLNAKLKEEVDKQLTTYKDMYEAGLINATEYAAKVKEANAQIPGQDKLVSAADKALTSVSDLATRIQTLVALQDSLTQGIIDKTTGAVIAYTDAQKQAILTSFGLVMNDSAATLALQNIQGQIDSILSAMGTATPTAPPTSEATPYTGFESPGGWGEGSPGLAIGAGNIPSDMPANLHKGEIVVPKTFADSLRSGDLVMSGNGATGGTAQPIIINVYGSVTSENDLADTIHKNLQKRKVRGYVT